MLVGGKSDPHHPPRRTGVGQGPLPVHLDGVSARGRVILSALSIAVFLLELAPLELQRRIVNGAVEHQSFSSF